MKVNFVMKIEITHETKFDPNDTVYYIDPIAEEITCVIRRNISLKGF